MSVPAQSTDDDPVGAGGFRGDNAGQPLLSRALNENGLAGSGAGVETGPLDAVSEREAHGGEFRGHVLGQAMKNRVRMKILKLAVAAPQTGSMGNGRGSISKSTGTTSLRF